MNKQCYMYMSMDTAAQDRAKVSSKGLNSPYVNLIEYVR